MNLQAQSAVKFPNFTIKKVTDSQIFVRDPISGFKLLTFQLSNFRESELVTLNMFMIVERQ